MSTETTMVFALSLLALLVSVPLVHSDQSMLPLRSFKISGNVTYDCIDIYKQPGLDHPLLKNHTIQMKPSFSRHETRIKRTYTKGIECPYGTVPILKNTKEYISNAQLFSEKNVHPLTIHTPGLHVALVRSRPGPFRGVAASLEGYNLNIDKDQLSHTQVSIFSVVDNQINFIQIGFMVNPSVFGDGRPWTYAYWMGSDGIQKACFKNPCPGFIQVSSQNPIVQPWNPGRLSFTIHQDKRSGNWWIKHHDNYELGYWPKELFNVLSDGANIVEVGGIVQASPSSPSPPMGSGNFPTTGGGKQSAKFEINNVLNSNYEPSTFPIQKVLDSPNCYGLTDGEKKGLGFIFNYGGPGGNSCGV